jgi:hypothetical protein
MFDNNNEHITRTLNKDQYSNISLFPLFISFALIDTQLVVVSIANYHDALPGSVMNHSLYATTSYIGHEQTTFIEVASSLMYK